MSLAESKTDIANMALSNLGSGKEISDLETERSQEASACRRFYDTALTATLRDTDWGFNRKIVSLTRVQDFRTTKVYSWEWDFSYQMPAEAIIVRRLGLGNRIDPLDYEVPFEIQVGTSGSLIMTNLESAVAQIGIAVSEVELYPPDFVLAVSMLLSALIAPRLTNGDPLGLGAKSYQKYQLMIASAQKNDIVQSGGPSEPESLMISERD
jgi:hypothetical protein